MFQKVSISFLLLFTLTLASAQKYWEFPDSRISLCFYSQQYFGYYFQNSSSSTIVSNSFDSQFPETELRRGDLDGLSMLYHIPTLETVYSNLPKNFEYTYLENSDSHNPELENRSSGFGYLELQKPISRFFSVNIGIGHQHFEGEYTSKFEGKYEGGKSIFIDFRYQQRVSYLFSNIQFKFQSPYFFQKISLFTQLGISIKQMIASSLSEDIVVFDENGINNFYNEYKPKRYNPSSDIILPSLGISYRLNNDVYVESSIQMNARYPLLSMDYNPFQTYLLNLGVRINLPI